MEASNCGAIEYIVLTKERTGSGLGRAIHDYAVCILTDDARRAGHSQLAAVMIEINDPFQVSAEADNVDPFERLRMWHKWGYMRLRFPYRQPALSDRQGAIDYLILGVRPIDPELGDGFPTPLAKQMVLDYLVWANRLTDLSSDPFFIAMSAYAESHPRAATESLLSYIGRDPGRPLSVRAFRSGRDRDYAATIAVYSRIFPRNEVAIDPARFALGLAAERRDGVRYHTRT